MPTPSMLRLASLALLAVTLASAAHAVRLPAVLGNHMVLQREAAAPLWGWGDPGEQITVTPSWRDVATKTVVGADGRWQVRIPTPAAGGPYKITIAGNHTITLRDVMIGEVWVCSGQSNMEWSINHGIQDGEVEAAAADFPRIRIFDVPHTTAVEPAVDVDARWHRVTPETVRSFSAVGYFFARHLHRELDVPIGLVGANWGGTRAEAWTSEEGLRRLGGYDDALQPVLAERADPGRAEREQRQQFAAWWQTMQQQEVGTQAGWQNPQLDHTDWDTVAVPGIWERTPIGRFDGAMWFRKTIALPDDWAGQDLVLSLGTIDDCDTAFFNGQRVGGVEQINQRTTPRAYPVPGKLVKPGENLIAVRVVDVLWGGGFNGRPDAMKLALAADPEQARPLAGSWHYRKGTSLGDLPPCPRFPAIHQNTPTTLFNGMVAPLMPYAIRGVIWYQGESNRTQARAYRDLFPAMIEDWRRHWGQGLIPFYFVQIAPYRYEGDTGQAAELREAQLMTLRVPRTGMAVTMDIGDPDDIHPRDKQTVGRRLALIALARTYGQNVCYSGPRYRRYQPVAAEIRLFFDHVADGLVAKGGGLTHFEVAGIDRIFHPATAAIDGNTIVVSSPQVPRPVAVRYAWGAADEPNLFNTCGLPASSFRTNDWSRDGVVSEPGE